MVVALFACLTICSGLTSAEANVITVTHLAKGDQMLPDGGWTSACDTHMEQCNVSGDENDANELYGQHHHHHVDCQFSALPTTPDAASEWHGRRIVSLPAYLAVIKPAGLSAADHPPKI